MDKRKDGLMTLPQAAREAQMDESTLRNAIFRGYLKATKYGPRATMIDPADLQAWLDNKQVHRARKKTPQK